MLSQQNAFTPESNLLLVVINLQVIILKQVAALELAVKLVKDLILDCLLLVLDDLLEVEALLAKLCPQKAALSAIFKRLLAA